MTNGTYTGQTDWCVGGVSKAYRSEVIPLSFEFTRSQNNDSTNIIIISPNYHRIIHKNNPHFNRKKFQFEFENGEVLRLKLYEHLKVG